MFYHCFPRFGMPWVWRCEIRTPFPVQPSPQRNKIPCLPTHLTVKVFIFHEALDTHVGFTIGGKNFLTSQVLQWMDRTSWRCLGKWSDIGYLTKAHNLSSFWSVITWSMQTTPRPHSLCCTNGSFHEISYDFSPCCQTKLHFVTASSNLKADFLLVRGSHPTCKAQEPWSGLQVMGKEPQQQLQTKNKNPLT